jgi:hypothetical protein
LLDGQFAKSKVIEAHQPGTQPMFTKVEMMDYNMIDHGTGVVVTCKGYYEGPKWSGKLKFMRVWLKKNNRWQIIAGTTVKL